jgi:hypothetical protein
MNKLSLISIIIAVIGIINIFGGSNIINTFTSGSYSTFNAAATFYLFGFLTLLPVIFALSGIYLQSKDNDLNIIQYILAVITGIIGIIIGYQVDVTYNYWTLLGVILLGITAIVNLLVSKNIIKGDLIG